MIRCQWFRMIINYVVIRYQWFRMIINYVVIRYQWFRMIIKYVVIRYQWFKMIINYVVIRYQRFSMVISSLYPLLTTQQSNNKNFNQLSKIQKRVIYILIRYQQLRMVTNYIWYVINPLIGYQRMVITYFEPQSKAYKGNQLLCSAINDTMNLISDSKINHIISCT